MRMLLVAALLAASVATASAQELPTPLKLARAYAIMMVYDVKCDSLPPKTEATLKLWDSHPPNYGIDGDLADTEAHNAVQQVKTIGKAKWCAAFKPIIQEMEDAR